MKKKTFEEQRKQPGGRAEIILRPRTSFLESGRKRMQLEEQLLNAVVFGSLSRIKSLVKEGANPYSSILAPGFHTKGYGRSILEFSVLRGRSDVVEALLKSSHTSWCDKNPINDALIIAAAMLKCSPPWSPTEQYKDIYKILSRAKAEWSKARTQENAKAYRNVVRLLKKAGVKE